MKALLQHRLFSHLLQDPGEMHSHCFGSVSSVPSSAASSELPYSEGNVFVKATKKTHARSPGTDRKKWRFNILWEG